MILYEKDLLELELYLSFGNAIPVTRITLPAEVLVNLIETIRHRVGELADIYRLSKEYNCDIHIRKKF